MHPVVKADAYGHGAIPIARALEAAGADGLCVATMDEAVVLREAGITLPIVVLYPIPPGLAPVARRSSIAVTAGDATLLDELLADLAASSPDNRKGVPPLDLQLEVETGLGRGGLSGADLVAAAHAIEGAAAARLAGLWTHLQAPEDALRTAGQLVRFERAASELRSARRGPPGAARRRNGWTAARWRRRARWRAAGPRDVRARPRRAAAGFREGRRWDAGDSPGDGRAATGPVAPRTTRPCRGAPGGHGDQLRPDVRHEPAEPDRHAAARLRRRLAARPLESR